MALIAAAALLAAFVFGQNAHAAAERDIASDAKAESRAFCVDLGFAPASDVYRRCTEGLDIVRRHAEQRSAKKMNGLI